MRRRDFVSLLAAPALRAETAVDRGRAVVNDALAALGGDRFRRLKDRVETGRAYSFYHNRLSGLARTVRYVQYTDAPRVPGQPVPLALAERQNYGKDGDTGVLFTGGEGYEFTYRGVRPLPEATVLRHRETTLHDALYLLRQRLDEPGLEVQSQGREVVDNQPVEQVEFYDRENRSVVVSFHHSTKLPVRQVFTRRDPNTRERLQEVTYFAKYRDQGGVQWPLHTLRQRDGDKVFEMFAETVAFDQDLKPELFRVTPGTPMLPPEKAPRRS